MGLTTEYWPFHAWSNAQKYDMKLNINQKEKLSIL